MRRQDAFGIERPPSTERITPPHITPPEGGDLFKPIRLPRVFAGAKSVIYDIQHQTVSYAGEDVGRPFPRTLGARRASTDLTPPSQIPYVRGTPPLQVRTGPTTVHNVTTATDRVTPPMIPRAVYRETTVIQPPAEAHTSAEPPLRNPVPVLLTRPTDPEIEVFAEAESVDSMTESIRAIHQRALYHNSSLSYQRFTFSLTKFPAIVLCMLTIWTIWGRGEGLNYNDDIKNSTRVLQERNADIAALTTGGFILVAQVLLLHQHYNHYKKAKVMSYLYHIAMLLAFCGSCVALVFAATSFKPLKGIKDFADNNIFYDCVIAHADPNGAPHGYLCLTRNQRIDYMAVILGTSALIIILATFTMITGAIGQALMKKRLEQEYQRLSAARANMGLTPDEHF